MTVTAFELRSEYQGQTEPNKETGEEPRPKFDPDTQLAVAGVPFEVGKELQKGRGKIVVRESDQQLVELLRTYAPLKETSAPKNAKPISRYERLPTDQIRHEASVRDVDGAGSLSREDLIGRLEAQDDALEQQDPAAAAQAAAGEIPSEPAASATSDRGGK